MKLTIHQSISEERNKAVFNTATVTFTGVEDCFFMIPFNKSWFYFMGKKKDGNIPGKLIQFSFDEILND